VGNCLKTKPKIIYSRKFPIPSHLKGFRQYPLKLSRLACQSLTLEFNWIFTVPASGRVFFWPKNLPRGKKIALGPPPFFFPLFFPRNLLKKTNPTFSSASRRGHFDQAFRFYFSDIFLQKSTPKLHHGALHSGSWTTPHIQIVFANGGNKIRASIFQFLMWTGLIAYFQTNFNRNIGLRQ